MITWLNKLKKYASKKFRDFLRGYHRPKQHSYRGAVGKRNQAYGKHWIKEQK